MNVQAVLFMVGLLFTPEFCNAAVIAACGAQRGQAYYPAAGMVPKNKAGWTADQFSGGYTTLTQDAKGEYDVVFHDATGSTLSARSETGRVMEVRRSANEVAVAVVYASGARAIEIYSFIRETDGKAKMLQLSSRGLSAELAVPKAGVYVADCSTLNLAR